jgi:NAD(P)-dependent dehydrogenase (short-subunit alcohol dehydrogenase family)
MAVGLDVSDAGALVALVAQVEGRLGIPSLLMNNAACGGGGRPYENPDGWRRILDVNLIGVLNGIQAFVPAMMACGQPALVINTGSKQGITSPPGNVAYNVTKAAVKTLTEGLAHALRETPGCQVSAHLLLPGFTYTGMIRPHVAAKPATAWDADQVVERLFDGIAVGRSYILCEDGETPRWLDERRILWAAGDIVEDRPALSRWHPAYKAAFETFVNSAREDDKCAHAREKGKDHDQARHDGTPTQGSDARSVPGPL